MGEFHSRNVHCHVYRQQAASGKRHMSLMPSSFISKLIRSASSAVLSLYLRLEGAFYSPTLRERKIICC